MKTVKKTTNTKTTSKKSAQRRRANDRRVERERDREHARWDRILTNDIMRGAL